MFEEIANNFTVKFGRTARTLDYEDSQGHITFTFGGHPKGNKWIFLETGGEKERTLLGGPRFDIAVERSKKFLESCNFEVEIYDPVKHPPIDTDAQIAIYERAGFHVERLSDRFIVTKNPNGGFLARIFRFFKKLT